MANQGVKNIATNRTAHFNYFLSDFKEAGLVLSGTEIKSLRRNGADLSDAYVIFRYGEAYLINLYIAPYDKGNIYNHEPRQDRKLLLHKREIRRLEMEVAKEGITIVPTKMYFKNGIAKVEIAIGKGKKRFDKRESIKERDQTREIARSVKGGKYDE